MNGITVKSLCDSGVIHANMYLERMEAELKKAKTSRQKNTVVIRSLEQTVSRIKTCRNHLKKAAKIVPLTVRRA